jgi:nucleoside phosphorylase
MPDAIIKPMRTAGCPELGPLALMISTRVDLKRILADASGCLVEADRSPLMSRLFISDEGDGVSVIGPMMGAPYAAALLETMIAWGARRLLFLGWCGAISPDVAIGDIIVPTGGLVDEGTSLHYGGIGGETASASRDARRRIKDMLSGQGLSYREGLVWSTDAPFRETPRKVEAALNRGAIAVEMETSALFTVSRYRKAAVGAILLVSDDLSSLSWRPGFKDKRFGAARRAVCGGLAKLCRTK